MQNGGAGRRSWFLTLGSWLLFRSGWLLALGVGLYTVVFTAAAWFKYDAYWMGFDLGVHEQLLWNTAHGRIAASSPSAGTASYFGIDIIITELLLTPLYWLMPSVRTLLLVQTLALALGALPVYWIACRRLGTALAGLAFAAMYLLYAPVQWMNLYEFQIRAFATTFLLLALHATERRRAIPFWIWSLLALGCRSDVGLVLAAMGVANWWVGAGEAKGQKANGNTPLVERGWLRSLLSRLRSRVFIFGLLPVIVGLGWTLLCVLVLVPAFRSDEQFLYARVIYGWLGDTPGAMLRRLLTDPAYVASYVFGPPNGLWRLSYLLQMFLPLAFLPLLAPRRLLPALPIFGLNLLSNTPNIHASTHYHYQALIIPFMLVAAIEGLAHLTAGSRQQAAGSSENRSGSGVPSLPSARFIYVLCGLLLLAGASNMSFGRPALGFGNPFFTLLTRPVAHQRNGIAEGLMARIPPTAAVAATSSLGPHLARREQLYVFPGDNIIYPTSYVDRADYLLVDSAELSAADQAFFDALRADGRYALLDSGRYRTPEGGEEELSLWRRR